MIRFTHGFTSKPPESFFQSHCTKSSVVIAAACHRKNAITPTVHSAEVMLEGCGRSNIDCACMKPDIANASHTWRYEERFVPLGIDRKSTMKPVALVRL